MTAYAPAPLQTSAPTLAPTQTAAPLTSSNTTVDLRAQLNGLLAASELLQTQTMQSGSIAPTYTTVVPIQTINTNLFTGSRGDTVKILQEFLISQNKGPAAKTLGNVGATAYFGPLTRAALAEFQTDAGISPAWGNFGPITRGYINAHYN